MGYIARHKPPTAGEVGKSLMNDRQDSRPFGLNRLLGVCCLAIVAMILLAAGYASEQRDIVPAAWHSVRPGTQCEQIVAMIEQPESKQQTESKL